MTESSKHNIEYHNQDQRKHYRLTTPFWVQADGKVYKTKDWSVGGLAISNYHKAVNQGDTIPLKIIIKFQGFNIGFEAQGKVVNVDGNNNLRLEFYNLSPRSQNILKFFSQSIISGEMVDIEDTIKRIDVPINVQDDNIEAIRGQKPPLRRWPLKSLFFTVLYLTIGLLVFFYIGLTVYSNFMHLKIESAVVSAPVEKIISPFNGDIAEYYAKQGSIVKKGDPIVRLVDHELERELKLEHTNLLAAQNDHGLISQFLETERNKLTIYSTIGKTKFDEAQSNVNEFKQRLAHLNNDHERSKQLYAKRVISKADLDRAEADYREKLSQFEEAKHQLLVHEKALKSVDEHGQYFSEDHIEGEIPQVSAKVAHAENQIEIMKEKIKVHEDQIARRTIRAPFDGHLVDVSRTVGNTISQGDELFMLERDEKRTVEAHLTQEEIVEVGFNTPAIVYIPLIEKRFKANVTHIDRTEGFIDEINGKYRPRTIKDRSAIVKLDLIDFNMNDARQQLRPGTPAVVYFDRSMFKTVKHRLKLYFKPTNTPAENININKEYNERINNNKVHNVSNIAEPAVIE